MNVPLTPIRFKRRAGRLYGRKTGVVCGQARFTYAEFCARCDRLSHALRGLGILPGERVAYLACNCHRLLEGYYGVVQMGGVLLPLNIRLSREDFRYILDDAGARVLFFDLFMNSSMYAFLNSSRGRSFDQPFPSSPGSKIDTS